MRKPLTNMEFTEKAKEIHNDLYDYSLVDYINNRVKIKIRCKKHGIFEQTPKRHLVDKCGCKKCFSGYKRIFIDDFLNRVSLIHGDKYDYSKVVFKTTKIKVEIICNKHGSFYLKPESHFKGRGCPICQSKSLGEDKIRNLLNGRNISFEEQRKFNGCKNILPLRYDFFIESKNILIEYDGRQHYVPSDKFGSINEFNKTKLRDEIKNTYAKLNGIHLIRIPYYEYNNIENILKEI